MPKILNADPDARGIYRRKLAYWLRHSVDGVQERAPLHTRDFSEAVVKAKAIRGKPTPGKSERISWKTAISRYIADKLAGKRPAHLTGRKLKAFRPGTALRVKSCLSVFGERCGADSPSKVTLKQLQSYYDRHAKNSKAGAKSTLAAIHAFLEFQNCLPGRVVVPAGHKPEARVVVVTVKDSNEWIASCPRADLKFVLLCGFHCGMRAGEITHSRLVWFDLNRRVLTIPGSERQRLPNGKTLEWQSKDGDTREIPLSASFCAFLPDFFAAPKRDFCLLSKGRAASGLFDFRAPFEAFVKAQGRPDVFPHAMRHSWISEICNSGNHTVQEVAAWSGDSLQTIERNYWHKRVTPGSLDSTLEGKRSKDEMAKLITEIQKTVKGRSDDETHELIAGAVEEAFRIIDWTKE